MIVSIHQPQYMPWIPYFVKVAKSDIFVILDSVDYQKNGLQNRNQIKTAQGPIWITVPVKHKLGQKIKDIEINNGINWRKKHWKTISQNYRNARNYNSYKNDLEELFVREWSSLIDINLYILDLMFRWLEIGTRIVRSSELSASGNGTKLILNICQELEATRYLTGIGGRSYLDEESFGESNIGIEYIDPTLPARYPQLYEATGFAGNLSALDIILNCGNDWKKYLLPQT